MRISTNKYKRIYKDLNGLITTTFFVNGTCRVGKIISAEETGFKVISPYNERKYVDINNVANFKCDNHTLSFWCQDKRKTLMGTKDNVDINMIIDKDIADQKTKIQELLGENYESN